MNYSEFINSEFFRFFNIRIEKSTEKASDITIVHLKTGGFQEHIDIFISIDKEGDILEGKLFLDRKWIGDANTINPFGTDISKSFIALLFPHDLQPDFKKHLIHYLFNLRGDNQVYIPLHKAFQEFEDAAPEVKPFLDVYRGQKESKIKSIEDFSLTLKNLQAEGKDRLLIKLSFEE